MKLRIAKKILKNKSTLKYHEHQIKKAENIEARHQKAKN